MGKRVKQGMVKIELRTTAAAFGYLVEMAESGLHGTTVEDVAEQLVRAGIRDYLRGR